MPDVKVRKFLVSIEDVFLLRPWSIIDLARLPRAAVNRPERAFFGFFAAELPHH